MEKLINIANLIKECKQYTKLYSITHGDVLLDRIDKQGNIFLKILPLDKNLVLKLDEFGRLYENGNCVLFPSLWNTWEDFGPYATTIESPFEAGMVGYNEHLNEFGIISDDGSFMTNVDGNRISPIDHLATEVEIDIWNQENHKKHRHYSLARKKFVYYFCPFDKVLVRQDRNKEWVADWFSHIISTEPEERIYVTVGGKCWAYCIPFGEETADLVGSACDYEENE